MPIYTKYEKPEKFQKGYDFFTKKTKFHFKGYFYFFINFFMNVITSAEGGPCKDYGECDEFKYSLNDTESLQRGASNYILIIVMGVTRFNILDGEELLRI